MEIKKVHSPIDQESFERFISSINEWESKMLEGIKIFFDEHKRVIRMLSINETALRKILYACGGQFVISKNVDDEFMSNVDNLRLKVLMYPQENGDILIWTESEDEPKPES